MKTNTAAQDLASLITQYQKLSDSRIGGHTGANQRTLNDLPNGQQEEASHVYNRTLRNLKDGFMSSGDLKDILSMTNLSQTMAEEIRFSSPQKLAEMKKGYLEQVTNDRGRLVFGGPQTALAIDLVSSAFHLFDSQSSLRTALEGAKDLVREVKEGSSGYSIT